MAKKRFPSDANKPKSGEKAAAPAKAPAAVSSSKQDLVQIQYNKENNHVLSNGVHSLAKGENHLPKAVWEASKSHPAIKQMIKDGHIVVSGDQSVGDDSEELPEPPADSALEVPADDQSPSDQAAG
jgi:hypothetical protein